MEDIRKMILDNKIAAVGGLWAVGMMGAFASQYSSKSAPSVKVIHSCVHEMIPVDSYPKLI